MLSLHNLSNFTRRRNHSLCEPKDPVTNPTISLCKHTLTPWHLLILIPIILLIFFLFFQLRPIQSYSYQAKLLEKMENAKDFETFCSALFQYEVTADSITTAYTLKNPEDRNIPTLEPKLTSFSYKEYLKASKEKETNPTTIFILDCLSRYSKDNLTEEQQRTHSLLTDYLNKNLSLSQYPFYENLLGSSSGVQANLPVTLGEYPLRTKTDVETYLQLLTQIPSYMDDVISYENMRKKLGYETPAFVTATSLETTKTMAEGFQNGDNSFIDTFDERITHIKGLSKKEIQNYKKTNQEYVEKYVIPSYGEVITHLQTSLAKTTDKDNSITQQITTDNDTSKNTVASNASSIDTSEDNSNQNSSTQEASILSYIDEDTCYGISTLPKGKEYYTHLAQYNTGSSKTVEEMITMTDQSLSNALGTVLNTALTNQEAYFYYCEHPLESYYQSPEAILDSLSLMIRKDYPLLKETPTYKVKTVSDSLASSLSPAFYMIPAIDDYQNNTIYINPLHTNEANGNLFPTLAHEGFPGHLYQTVYFNESNPSDIRQILDYLGYVEGWATYVEIDSLRFLDYPLEGDTLCNLYQTETIINLALCARIDMGVNYEGWTLNDTRAFFEEQGFNSYYAQDVYSYVVEAPANYLSYFIGYLEIMEIKDAYQRQELENYSEQEFHKRFLDVGPADFETVGEYVLKK